MTGGRTYLDWNATAPLRPEARAACMVAMEVVGNPSSPHAEGRRARAIVEDARERVAALVGAKPAEVVFTSGGTEANNAVLGAGWDAIVLSGTEHHSVLAPARAAKAAVTELPVARDGAVQMDLPHPAPGMRAVLSLQMANNETGVLQPVAQAAAAARDLGYFVHTDAVQAAGRIPVVLSTIGADFLSISAHKIGGPKGVGALMISQSATLPAYISGGGQERRRRAGTENVAAIAGFGAAAEAALGELPGMSRIAALRDSLEQQVRAITPQAVFIGNDAPRLPNTTCIAFGGVSAETLVISFDLAGIAVSAGAACSSGKVGASHVLHAMGVEQSLARSAIRVSLGCSSTERDVAAFVAAWSRIAARQRERAVA